MRSIKHAIHGIFEAFNSEPNFKIHIIAAIFTLVAGVFFSIHTWEWVAVIGCIIGVMSLELMNTGIEKMMDHLHPAQHEKVRQIKDVAAGAVLLCALGSVIIAAIIFIPKIAAFIIP